MRSNREFLQPLLVIGFLALFPGFLSLVSAVFTGPEKAIKMASAMYALMGVLAGLGLAGGIYMFLLDSAKKNRASAWVVAALSFASYMALLGVAIEVFSKGFQNIEHPGVPFLIAVLSVAHLVASKKF